MRTDNQTVADNAISTCSSRKAEVGMEWSGLGGLLERQIQSPKGSVLFVLAEGFYREQRNGPDKKMACVDRKEDCIASTSAQTRI